MILRVRHQLRGDLVHADVFVGDDGAALSLSGRLVFSRTEWAALQPFAEKAQTLVDLFCATPEEALSFELEHQ